MIDRFGPLPRQSSTPTIRRSTSARRAALLLLFVASTSATPSTAADGALRSDLQQAASWGATVAWLGEGWLAGRLPQPYVVRTLGLAGEALGRSRRTIDEDLDGHPVAPDPRADVDRLRESTKRLDDAIGRRDRATVAALVADLHRASQRLRTGP